MNEFIVANLGQAMRLAWRLRQVPDVADVCFDRTGDGNFRLTYESVTTTQQEQLLARAARALQMAEEGYQVEWAGNRALVLSPSGQVYDGDLERCTCADMLMRQAATASRGYKGPCKHCLYRLLDVLEQAGQQVAQRPARRPRARRPARRTAKTAG